jgi:hypothetical protein
MCAGRGRPRDVRPAAAHWPAVRRGRHQKRARLAAEPLRAASRIRRPATRGLRGMRAVAVRSCSSPTAAEAAGRTALLEALCVAKTCRPTPCGCPCAFEHHHCGILPRESGQYPRRSQCAAAVTRTERTKYEHRWDRRWCMGPRARAGGEPAGPGWPANRQNVTVMQRSSMKLVAPAPPCTKNCGSIR